MAQDFSHNQKGNHGNTEEYVQGRIMKDKRNHHYDSVMDKP